jgi:hypothetical protein
VTLASKPLAPWLWLLLTVFCFRVVAQLLQWLLTVPFLPPFAAWHSGALPYGVLVATQILIIALMARVCYRFSRGHVQANHRLGAMLLLLGAIYFLGMLARLLVGLFVLPEHGWFGQILPAVFHLVLALFVLLVGRFHYAHGREAPR